MKGAFVRLLKGSEGLALFMVIFVMAVFLLFLTGGLFFSQLELKKANNFKLATQALEVADAGVHHALAVIPMAWDFDSQLNCPTPPCTVVSNASFPSGSGFSYTVAAKNDLPDINNGGSSTNDTNNLILLTSEATGPNNSKKVVEAYVKRSLVSFTPPAALYLPASTVKITFFDGNPSFSINGNDTAYDGTPAASPKPAIPGVAPINNTVRGSFETALGSSRYQLVQGFGYAAGPPVTPSVTTTSQVFDVNQIALNFYNHPNAVKFLNGLALKCSSVSPCTLGTDASPQITYIRESLSNHIHLDGYVSGSGVLVTEGQAHIYGNFNFHGLVVGVNLGLTGGTGSAITDDPDPFSIRNNAKIFGGLLIGPTNAHQIFDMRHSAKIYYSSQALTMANNLCGSCLPQPPRVFAWLDK